MRAPFSKTKKGKVRRRCTLHANRASRHVFKPTRSRHRCHGATTRSESFSLVTRTPRLSVLPAFPSVSRLPVRARCGVVFPLLFCVLEGDGWPGGGTVHKQPNKGKQNGERTGWWEGMGGPTGNTHRRGGGTLPIPQPKQASDINNGGKDTHVVQLLLCSKTRFHQGRSRSPEREGWGGVVAASVYVWVGVSHFPLPLLYPLSLSLSLSHSTLPFETPSSHRHTHTHTHTSVCSLLTCVICRCIVVRVRVCAWLCCGSGGRPKRPHNGTGKGALTRATGRERERLPYHAYWPSSSTRRASSTRTHTDTQIQRTRRYSTWRFPPSFSSFEWCFRFTTHHIRTGEPPAWRGRRRPAAGSSDSTDVPPPRCGCRRGICSGCSWRS